MLQKFGLIKYNGKLFFEKNLSASSKRSLNKAKINNYFLNSYLKNNPINLKENHKKISLTRTNYNPDRIKYTKDIDEAISNNINNFISESTYNVQVNDPRLSFVKINHNINDDIIYRNNNKLKSLFESRLSKSQINNRTSKQLLYVKNKYNINENENQKNNSNSNIEDEINNRKEFINKLIINNNSILNKINILKNEYNNNLMTSTEADSHLTNNLFNKHNLKKNNAIIDNELFELRQTIIELKNKLSLVNNKQISTNLILFKEKMENDLKKEDVNKMNKLIENVNKDIKKVKKEIFSINAKNKKISMEINAKYLSNTNKK